MGHNNLSDYGSGSSANSFSSWGGQEDWLASNSSHQKLEQPLKQKSSSLLDLVMKQCTLEDALKEFRMNGSDSPYNPDEDKMWGYQTGNLIGMGPSSVYLRQKSWPEPERSPAVALPREPAPPSFPASSFSEPEWKQAPAEFQQVSPATLVTREVNPYLTEGTNEYTSYAKEDVITEEQFRVLASLPNNILYILLRELEQSRGEKRSKKRVPDECRFCKNNGERASYYRSHPLRDAGGRVACPVLRAFVCPRCGARGARAHTAKYCPLSTNEERMKSAAMMRSVRMASGRRRVVTSTLADASTLQVGFASSPTPQESYDAPLDPLWAALEQKLML